MAKTYYLEIANLFGVKPDEEFYMVDEDGYCSTWYTYKFTENGLFRKSDDITDFVEVYNHELIDFLNGKATIRFKDMSAQAQFKRLGWEKEESEDCANGETIKTIRYLYKRPFTVPKTLVFSKLGMSTCDVSHFDKDLLKAIITQLNELDMLDSLEV